MYVLDYDITNLIMWLLLGITSGFTAHLVDPGRIKGGLLSSIVTGIGGAILGGLVANILLGVSITGFNISSVLIAIASSLMVLYLYRFIFRDHHHEV